MSVNVFEVIVKKEINPFDRVFNASPANNAFTDFVYSSSLNQSVPKFYTTEGLSVIQNLLEDAITNSDFTLGFSQDSDSINGNDILSSFQTPSDWILSTFSIDNHGLSQDKSELSEESTSNGYDYYTGSERIIPKLFLNSQKSTYEGSDVLAANSKNGTFENGSLTNWALFSGATNETDGVADFAHIETNSSKEGIQLQFLNNEIEANSVYKLSFNRIATTTSFNIEVKVISGGKTKIYTSSDSATAGVEDVYFTLFDASNVLLNVYSTAASSVVKLDDVTIKKVVESERVGDTDNFAYLPSPTSDGGFAQPNHRYSLMPDSMIDFGCFQTLNTFKFGAWDVRKNTVEGTFGNSARHIKYEHSDFGIINGNYYSDNFKSKWFYYNVLINNKDHTLGDGQVLAPTILRFRDVFNPLDVGKTVKFTANLTFDKNSENSDEIIDGAHPSFDDASIVATEMLSNNEFLLGNSNWGSSGSNWSFSNGQAVYGFESSVNDLTQAVSIVGGKTYLLYVDFEEIDGVGEFEAYFSSNVGTLPNTKIQPNRHVYIKASGSGSINTSLRIKRSSGVNFSAKINSVTLKDTSRLQLESPILSSVLVENSSFNSGAEGWSEVDSGVGTFSSVNSNAVITVVNAGGNNRIKSVDAVIKNGKQYKVTYKVDQSSITTLQFYDGSTYRDVPHTLGIHTFTFTNSGGSEANFFFNAVHASAGSSIKVTLNEIVIREVLPSSDYYGRVSASNTFEIKGTYGSLNDNILKLQLHSGQSYRLQFDIASMTNVDSLAFMLQDSDTASIYDFSKASSAGKLAIDFNTNQNDTGYINVSLRVLANFSTITGSVSLTSIRFSKNTITHEHILKNSFYGAVNSQSNFIITTSDFSNNEGVIEQHYVDQSNNIKVNYLPSSEYTIPSDADRVISKRAYCNPFQYATKANFLEDETYRVLPSEDCPVDSDGFYTGGAIDVTAEIKVGSPHLNFFTDSFSTSNLMRSTVKLNSVTFHTCEDAYITKDPSTANALKLHYDDSSSTKAPEAITELSLPPDIAKAGSSVNLNWDVQSLTGSFVLDFDNDDGNSAIISSAGTGNQSLVVDGHALRIRTLRGDELATAGSELLSNDSFDSTSNWTLGSAWSITGGKAAITEATAITTPGFTYARLGLRQDSVLTAGDTYKIEINVAATNGKALSIVLGAADDLINETNLVYTEEFSVGTHTIEAVAGGTDFLILADLPFIGEINSVSVKKLTGPASKSVDAVINSISLSQLNTGIEYRSEKWGDESTSNYGLGKGIVANTSAVRIYSANAATGNLTNSSGEVLLKSKVQSTRNKDKVTLTIYPNYLGTNNTVTITHNFTSPNTTTTETVTSAGIQTFTYTNTSTDSGGGFDERFLNIKFNSDGSNPLDCVFSFLSVEITESAQDSEVIHLDLYDDFTLPINLTKKDYNNLDSINGDYTKSISVPATSNNKNAIEFSNELNTMMSSSQRNGFEALVKSGGVKVFEGLLFLSETNLNEDGAEELILNMRSGNSNWAERLKNKRLRSLTSQDYPIDTESVFGYDSSLDTDTVINLDATQGTSIFQKGDEEILFPLVDNGKIYEDIDELRVVSWDNIKPAYKIFDVVENMFNEIGYSLNSEFFFTGSEWSNDFNQGYSSFKQNLIGIAPSIFESDESIDFTEIDLSYSSSNTNYNSQYEGKEPSYFSIASKNTPRPRLKSIFLNKEENNPDKAYFCDWAFLRFDTTNKDLSSGHILSNINAIRSRMPDWFIPKSGSSAPNKTIGFVSPEKSHITVSKSGYYILSANITMTIRFSAAYASMTGNPDGNKFTLALIPSVVDDTVNSPYLDSNSFGTECFDITEESSLELPDSRIRAEGFRVNLSRVQYLSKDITYNVIAINGTPRNYDFSGALDNKHFIITQCELNIKLSADQNTFNGKNSLLYNRSAIPVANYSNTLPDVSCLEFASELSKMFNLVWDVNETTKTVTVEPFEDFYKFEGSRFGLNETPSISQSWEGYASFSDLTATQCTLSSVGGSGIVMTPVASPSINPLLSYNTAIPTVKGKSYSLQFYYNTFRRFKARLGRQLGTSDIFVTQFIESSPDAGDISSQSGTFTAIFRAVSSETYLSFVIKDGINLGGAPFNSLTVNDFLVVGLEDNYVNWTDKALVKNVKENYVVKSDIHFKMKEDSSDYKTSQITKGVNGIKFGDKLIEPQVKTSNDVKDYSLKIFSALKMDKSLFIVDGESLFLPNIWSKPKNNRDVIRFEDLPDPNNEHEHKLAAFSGVGFVPNDKSVGYSLDWVYNYSAKRLERQKIYTKRYLSAASYSEFESDFPNLTFSNLAGLSSDRSIYEDFHAPLIDMLSFRDKMITASVALSYSDLSDINFRDIIHIDGNIYILNKVKDFNFSGEPTEVELLLVTLTK